MKKSGFLQGAFIATASVIICKILGLIYVIPFYDIIGNQGGALYSYAYEIYSIFLSLSTVGIPTAISKIISEYNTLNYQHLKERAYKMGSKILSILGIICFIALFVFAPQIAYLIKGDSLGGNSLESITLVIRTISTALLIVPMLSVNRGYLQGHKFIMPSEISAVIEQLVRVVIIVLGSFLALKVFNLGLDISVSIAVLGATIGALISYLYLKYKIKKNKDVFKITKKESAEEKKVTAKALFKKILFYAIPFVLIDIIKSSYSIVDLFTIVKTLTNLGYSAVDAENVMGVISTWASKLNMIIISISIGITASLIPHIMPSFVKKDFKDVSKKVNEAMQILVVLTIPMTIGLSFLSYPVWNAFYGYDQIGVSLFSVNIFIAITLSFQSILVDTSQIMNNTKLSFGSLFLGLLVKLLLNVPMMHLCKSLGFEAYYGSSIASIISQASTISFLLWQLHCKYHITYQDTVKVLGKTLISCVVMVIALFGLKFIFPIEASSRIMSIIICVVYGLVGAIIYFYLMLKLKAIPKVNKLSDIKNLLKNN